MKKILLFAILAVASACYAASPAEVVTQEQIRSASCAMTAMPKPALDALLSATKTYLKSRDQIQLMRAFPADEVPTYIAKCFEIHAVATPKERTSNRDFAHFYDGSERALRLRLVIEVAKEQNQSVETIKKMNNQMNESLLRFNQEYY